MKKLLFGLLAVLFTAGLISWHKEKTQYSPVEKAGLIECLNMETQQAYKLEASTPAFAAMHPSPIKVNPDNLLGKMIGFDAADGKQANAYFIPSKKKSNKWLIVIQEWWGLNNNIKAEADKYYTALEDMNVIAVDMYDGKVTADRDEAGKL